MYNHSFFFPPFSFFLVAWVIFQIYFFASPFICPTFIWLLIPRKEINPLPKKKKKKKKKKHIAPWSITRFNAWIYLSSTYFFLFVKVPNPPPPLSSSTSFDGVIMWRCNWWFIVLLWLPFSIGQGSRLKKLFHIFHPYTPKLLIIIKLCPVYYVLNTQIISEIVIFKK
jgi:hypothetical protein